MHRTEKVSKTKREIFSFDIFKLNLTSVFSGNYFFPDSSHFPASQQASTRALEVVSCMAVLTFHFAAKIFFMGFIYHFFPSLFCLIASMATAIVLHDGNRASFINGRSIVIPHSLMTLEGGSHAVSLDGHEIIVKLLTDRGEIIPVFTVPVAFSVDKDLNKIPIVKLLTEVLTSLASKKQDIIVASGLSEVVHYFINCK